MKILLCSSTFQTITHGPAKFAQLLLQINEQFPEHEVRILTEGVDQAIPQKVYKIQTQYPRLFHSFWPYLNNYSYFKAAMRIRREYPFDILIFNNAVQSLVSTVFKPKEVKVFGIIHDDDYLSVSWKNFSFSKKWLINIHRKPLEYLACKFLDGLIVNSNYIERFVEQTYHCKRDKIDLLYMTVEIPKIDFHEHKAIDQKEEITILFVKSDYPRGGLKLLIDALALLDYNFKLIIIGPKEMHKRTIESYFKGLNNVKCIFMGPCDQEIVFEQMRQADIFCVPAHKEGLGMANIEALASGIPVVSTNIGGIPEVLDYGRNGWLCENDESKSLAIAIKDCIESPTERKAKSRIGRTFVEEKFNHKVMLQSFLRIVEQ